MGKEVTYLICFFQKDLVVFAEGDTEYYGCDILETMDPFLSFTSLTTDVEHAITC